MSERTKKSIQIIRVSHGTNGSRPKTGSDGYLQPLNASDPLRSVSDAPPTNHPAVFRGEGIALQCEDGHRTTLGGRSALLTGRSQARDRVLSAILTNEIARGGSVIMLTGSSGEGMVERIARDVCRQYAQPMRVIRKEEGTPGFAPLAGWSVRSVENFFCKKIAAAYIGHSAMPSDGLRMSFNALIHLARSSEQAARRMIGGAASTQALLEICQMAEIPEQDEYARLFRSCSEDALRAVQILGDYLRTFERICVSDAGGERYNLFSSGLTVLKMNDQSVQEFGTAPWYLCQMAGMIGEIAPGGVTLLVDSVSEEVLRAFSGVLMNQQVRLLVVCENYAAFGSQELRSRFNTRFKQQFIFTQQEGESARYWSMLSGERKVLTNTYNTGSGNSHSFLQLPTYSYNQGTAYAEVFRPKLEITHFTEMSLNEGELLEVNSQTGEAFHHFSL